MLIFALTLRPLRAALVGPVLAQLTQLRDGFGSALGLLFMVGFFWGVLKILERSERYF